MDDKFQLSLEQNIFVAKKRLVSQIYHLSRFENCQTTLLQTQKILDGRNDGDVLVSDIGVIVSLKRGFEYVFFYLTQCKAQGIAPSFDVALMCKINGMVAVHDALVPGELRTGRVGVSLYDGGRHEPDVVSAVDVCTFMAGISPLLSKTERILTIMLYMMRSQLFWDGNKRTAIVFANAMLIWHGLGMLEIDDTHFDGFNVRLSKFYRDNDADELMAFLHAHCIFGIEF